MHFLRAIKLAVLILIAPAAGGQSISNNSIGEESSLDESLPTLDTVVVTGTKPGPGMWRVTKGNHKLWIFGTLSPVPATIEWNAQPVLDVVSNAQVVLWEPYFTVDVNVGLFKRLWLGYGYWKAQKNPGQKPLKDVLPAHEYARWQTLKQKHLPSDGKVEKARPAIAAGILLNAAIKNSGLSKERIVVPPVLAVARTKKIKISAPSYVFGLSDAEARRILQDARQESMNDIHCFAATMDVIEHDLPQLITNANAWATGDIDRIDLNRLDRRDRLCSTVLSDTNFSRKHGIPNIQESVIAAWMDAANYALDNNTTTVSFLPIGSVIREGGYIDRLRSEGYEVDPP
ncbi:TraB/GumN family protein [Pseudoxanthomonas beigongshangi]